jgi:DNA-binding MarR family transcriptional regulator
MTEPRWLDPDEALAWRQLLAVIEHLPAAIDAQLKRDAELGRFEYTVLAMASGSPDRSVSMLELSRLTHGSLSRLSHTVSRMEARGLVKREQRGGSRFVSLTDEGWGLLQRHAPAHVEEVRRLVFDRLPAGSVTELSRILAPVAEHLSSQPGRV